MAEPYAATSSTRSSGGRLQGTAVADRIRTLPPQRGDQPAEPPRARPGERGCPGGSDAVITPDTTGSSHP
jgi:hypothetical protein